MVLESYAMYKGAITKLMSNFLNAPLTLREWVVTLRLQVKAQEKTRLI